MRRSKAKCQIKGCSRVSLYCFPFNRGDKVPVYCRGHKLPGMVKNGKPYCLESGCDISPRFGYLEKPNIMCGIHKAKDMVDTTKKRCTEVNCKKPASYGIRGEGITKCSFHRTDAMIDLKNIRCFNSGCNKWPTFGYNGKRARYCVDHKLEGMIDVKNRRCQNSECLRRPTFGYDGEKPRFCLTHKLVGMDDVRNPRCDFQLCKMRRTLRSKFCRVHIDSIVTNRPIVPNCHSNQISHSSPNDGYFVGQSGHRKDPEPFNSVSDPRMGSNHRLSGNLLPSPLFIGNRPLREGNGFSHSQLLPSLSYSSREGQHSTTNLYDGDFVVYNGTRPDSHHFRGTSVLTEHFAECDLSGLVATQNIRFKDYPFNFSSFDFSVKKGFAISEKEKDQPLPGIKLLLDIVNSV